MEFSSNAYCKSHDSIKKHGRMSITGVVTNSSVFFFEILKERIMEDVCIQEVKKG